MADEMLRLLLKRYCASILFSLLLMLTIFTGAPVSAQTDECLEKFGPNKNLNPPYAKVSDYDQVVCEGFYVQQISQSWLEPLSLTSGLVPEQTEVLHLRVATAKTAIDNLLRLQIVPNSPDISYRIDAELRNSSELSWKTLAAHKDAGLRIKDFGYIAWQELSECKKPDPYACILLRPVSFNNASTESATLVIRNSTKLKKAKWRIRHENCESRRSSGRWQMLPDILYPWTRTKLKLQQSECGGQRIEVRAKDVAGKNIRPLRLRINY